MISKRLPLVLLPLILSPFVASPDSAAGVEKTPWVVVQPGYPGSTRDAEGFMSSFSNYLGKHSSLGPLSGTYYNLPEEALSNLRTRAPGFALISLGFYLKYRRQFGFEALLADFGFTALPLDLGFTALGAGGASGRSSRTSAALRSA